VIGSIVMAMVVLTGDDPFESFLTLLRRCLCVHLPMSIICTRYFRDIGVSFEWNGTVETWEGISTSKNVLGQVTMLGVLVFYWELRRRWKEVGWKNIYLVYLLMAIYLLKGSANAVSMTSVAVCLFALLIFLRIQSLRSRPAAIRSFVLVTFGATVALITLVIVHSISPFSETSLFGLVITSLGRDITMTGRTEIWHDVYQAASGNPLFGVGFGGVWIGRLANIPWNAHMSWVLGQAHSGYVDTYLQIGLVGAFLMAMVFFSTVLRLLNSLTEDFDFGCFRITLFLTILFINITEAVYLRGDHHLWLILLLAICMLPAPTKQTDDPLAGADELDHPVRPSV